MGAPGGSRGARPWVVGTGVVVVVVAAAVLVAVVGHRVHPGGRGLAEVRYLALAAATGLFLAAGLYRLATWHLVRSSHSGLLGSALVVVGLGATPAPVLAQVVAPDPAEVTLAGAGTLLAATLIAFAFVTRALGAPRPGAGSSPARLLPAAFAAVGAALLVTLLVEWTVPGPVQVGQQTTDLLAHLLAASGWVAMAVLAARQARFLPWAGRVAPLLGGMGAAELMRGVAAVGGDWWALTGLLVAVAVGVLATRTAVGDLDAAIRATQDDRARLHRHVEEAAHELARLADWRSQVRHDARNTCAGLRAAMEMLGDDHPSVVATAHTLRQAAVSELWRLEQLLTTTDDDAMVDFQVLDVVDAVVGPARGLGREVLISGSGAHVLGRPDQLSLALHQLLLHAGLADPAARIGIDARPVGGRAHLTVTTDRPRRPPAADAPELRAARLFVRRQGGELVGSHARPGSACYVVRLRTATWEVA